MQDIERRIRVIEERLNMIRKILENVQTNLIEEDKKNKEKISSIEKEVKEIKKEIDNLKIKVNAILDQLPLFATKDRVEVIEKYLDLINPFDFVTKKEVENIIKNYVKQILKKEEEIIK